MLLTLSTTRAVLVPTQGPVRIWLSDLTRFLTDRTTETVSTLRTYPGLVLRLTIDATLVRHAIYSSGQRHVSESRPQHSYGQAIPSLITPRGVALLLEETPGGSAPDEIVNPLKQPPCDPLQRAVLDRLRQALHDPLQKEILLASMS